MTDSAPRRILRLRAMWELFRYDLVAAIFGFRGVYRSRKQRLTSGGHREGLELEISNAVEWATAFYWKRVRCLQRSIVTTRLLRTHGVAADLVIGCRLAPFVGHAWVEVNGRVLVGPAAYPEKLQILDRA
jgi:hypothetical protein